MFQLQLTDSSSESIDIIGHVEVVYGRGYLSLHRDLLQNAVLPETFPLQKLLSGLSQSHADAPSSIAKAALPIRPVRGPSSLGDVI